MSKRMTVEKWMWGAILCFVLSSAALHADRISAQFNDKTVFGETGKENDEVVFDLGGSVDLSQGSISLWVRPEWYGGGITSVDLISLTNSIGAGIQLSKFESGGRKFRKAWNMRAVSNGSVVGHTYSQIADWVPGFSHQLAITWSKDELRIYIDGVNNSKIQTQLIPGCLSLLKIPNFTVRLPHMTFTNLILSDRAFSAEEVEMIRDRQSPARIKIKIPDHSLRMVYPDESIRLQIKNDKDKSVKGQVTYVVEDITGETPLTVKKEAFDVTLPAKESITVREFAIPRYGLFQVSAELRTPAGEILSQDNVPFGSGMNIPPNTDFAFGRTYVNGLRFSKKDLEAIKQTGAQWIRTGDQFEGNIWDMVEHEKGVFDWKVMDENVRLVKESGLKLVPVLHGIARWASSLPKEDEIAYRKKRNDMACWFAPKSLADYSNFVSQIVQRYKNEINTWMVVNEPNGCFLVWNPDTKDVYGVNSEESIRGYFNFQKTAYLATKAADPNARIVGPVCNQEGHLKYYPELLKLGILKYTDIVGFDVYTPRDRHVEVGFLEMVWDKFKTATREAGGKQPIWSMEHGYMVWPRISTAPLSRSGFQALARMNDKRVAFMNKYWAGAFDELTAAQYEVRHRLLLRGMGIENANTFNWLAYPEEMGTYDVNQTPLLGTLAYAAMAGELSGFKFVKKILTFGEKRFLYLFSDGRSARAVAWTADTADILLLKIGKTAPKVRDILGNPVNVVTKGDLLYLPVSGSPQYIENIPSDIACQKDFLTLESPSLITDAGLVPIHVEMENSDDKNVIGSLKLILPSGWQTKDNPINFDIAPGEKKRIEFPINVSPQDDIRNGIFETKVVAAIKGLAEMTSSKSIYKRIPSPCHYRTDTTSKATYLILSNRSQVFKGLSETGSFNDAWKGPTDSSASILPAWDVDHLYLSIDVVDKNICTKMQQPWEGDCIELFIDEAGRKENLRPTTVDQSCSQIFLIPEGEGKIACSRPEKIKDAKVAMRKTGYGYRMELSLPWANFPEIKAQKNSVFGFDAILDNADPNPSGAPEAKSKMVWAGLGDNWNNASRNGRIILSENISYSNGFENGLGGWMNMDRAGGPVNDLRIDGRQAFSGTQSLKITKTAYRIPAASAWSGAFIPVSFTNKVTYQFSCRMKLPDGAPDEPTMNLSLQYRTNSNAKARQIAKMFTPRSLKAADGWKEMKCIFTIDEPEGTGINPDGGDGGIIFPTGTTANCSLLIDDFELRVMPDGAK